MLSAPANAELIYVTANSVYTQNFNSLPTSVANNPWVNDTTLDGWYSTSGTINASSGTGAQRTLYSFGADFASDRALGVVSQGASSDALFGLAIRNESGNILDSFTVRFDGEQWRRSTTNIGAAQTLMFGYRTSTTLGAIASAAYTNVSSLGFTSPGFSLPGGATDGNDSANRTSNITGTINGLTWRPGEYLWLSWQGQDNGMGSRHGLGIDNFSFSANSSITAVPEPSSLILVSAVGWLAFRYRKRFKLSA
ncbi:MAG: PEP-CTERM sorting domain-containing protein [Pirellulaceae bacterium]|nr:PEP-CTERM sorting domain-containing protein [Pirellulaceae bacterium]